jgi:cation diffusion facilitator CzcD-associated flavoprotein CzcO
VTTDDSLPEHHRVVIVGAGFAGIGVAARLIEAGVDDLVVLERADAVGGTWRDNSYPGCQCDVPTNLYSFSFAPKPDWSRTFAEWHEIRDYLEAVTDDFGVRPHLRLGHEVLDASWDEPNQRWIVTTPGATFSADLLIAGYGPLSEPAIPEIEGLGQFEGAVFHSAAWRHDQDLNGERVAVIGTGASAIQFVPRIQPQVSHLTVFQRTPPWIVPRPDRPFTEREHQMYRRFPIIQRISRALTYWSREALVVGMAKRPSLMRFPEQFARAHLASQVEDLMLREELTPTYQIGCKRILLSNDYYPSLTQPNVDVVTTPIASVGSRSIVTADGTELPVDTIILGTGFHVTDHPAAQRIHGSDGTSLAEAWAGGAVSHLGTTVAGFPNLVVMVGPNTGIGHTSMVFMMEAQIRWLLDALHVVGERGAATFEVRPEVQEASVNELQGLSEGTVWLAGCGSWYLDDAGRNTTIWPTFTWQFHHRLSEFDPDQYVLDPPREPGRCVRASARAGATSTQE